LGLIREYLKEIGSDLFVESAGMQFPDLLRAMNIARGPKEYFLPTNVGLLFFNRHPEDFFPRAWIEVVFRKDDYGDQFEEAYFKGPLHHQLRDALAVIKNTIIREKVVKVDGRAEANRFYNFPFEAVEEALANAVYHKGYDQQDPIEVQIFPDKIVILSFPGPVPPIDAKMLKNERQIWSKNSRNRRIGDFLKELELTEGRNTGIPKIYRAMERNKSPKPIFQTDDDRITFLTILPVHEQYNETEEQLKSTAEILIKGLTPRQQKIVDYVRENGNITNAICQELTGVSTRTATRELRKLVEAQLLLQIGRSKNITYMLTE